MRLILYIIPLSTFRINIWTLEKVVSVFRIPWIGMSFLVWVEAPAPGNV